MVVNCVLLIDVDSFDLQICEKEAGVPHDETVPTIVGDRWGVITSLNSVAKTYGISRNDTVESAMVKCPALRLMSFPILKTGKPDYTGRRALTHNIIKTIQELFPMSPVEMSSCDEFYVDLTDLVQEKVTGIGLPRFHCLWPKHSFQSKFHSGHSEEIKDLNDLRSDDLYLFQGAILATDLLTKIVQDLGVHASVGVGYNKLVAKLACGLGKPAGLSIVSNHGGLDKISNKIPLTSVPGLGGKAGELLSERYKTMADLGAATIEEIMVAGKISKQEALKFLRTCNGNCEAKVKQLTYFSSINIAKQYPEGSTLTAIDLQDDLEGLCEELVTRIEEEIIWNGRRSRVVTVSIKLEDESTQGIRVSEVSSLSAPQILAETWNQFKYAHHTSFRMKRIDLTVKNFDLER